MKNISPEYKLAEHFKFKEFFCIDIAPPKKYFANVLLCAKELEKVRQFIDSPIIITSGYRTPAWNAYVGGVRRSYHLYGKAVDIRVTGMPLQDLAIYVANLTEFKGYGVCTARNFLHCDMRPQLMVFKY